MQKPGERRQQHIGKWITVAALVGVLGVMLTLVSYSVPLYRLFCAATGFGGQTQRAAVASNRVSSHVVTVRFETNVAPGLPWRFMPLQSQVKVHLGEEKLVFFSAQNLSEEPIVGHATFNVTPTQAGIYFNKIQCFCFSEEQLGGHDSAVMPVDFFVAPAFGSDPETRDIDTITLSYTFFRSADPAGAKNLSRFTASPEPDPQRGERLFAEGCAGCHSLDQNKVGPMLGGVVGRLAASVRGYDYSPALRQSGIRWSAATLNRWLAGPQSFIPGVKMPVHVEDATMRRDIIVYLQSHSHAAGPTRQTASAP
jgi:cytochrome c oxidase assembly protein subunit 11